MRRVPFFANDEDNQHCALAVYRMLFAHFLHRELSWREVEKMAGFAAGRAACTLTMWQRMAAQGFDIRMIEAFDYARYSVEGDTYLRNYFSPEEYIYQTSHTNIASIVTHIPAFLEQIKPEQRRPTLDDIDEMLADGRLVFATLNAKTLNGAPGFAAHAVLIIDREGDDYIVHDPGLPARPERRVPRAVLWQAMSAGQSTSEVTGVKFRPRPTRADVLLARRHPEFSRAALAKLFGKGLVTLNGKVLKSGEKVLSDAVLAADLSSLTPDTSDIELPVLYEDDDCLVINKPAGILSHAQGRFVGEATVATFLRKHLADDLRRDEDARAGIVHRLDRATSGIIICAKNQAALSFLQKQFSERSVQKTYAAVVEGQLKNPQALIDMPIERNPKAPATFRVGANGKPAATAYKVLAENARYSLLELKPVTGRTHQLRVHLKQIGHPIVGDPLYGGGTFGDRLFLHARSLEVTLPSGERRTFESPLPPEFNHLMQKGEAA